MTANHEAHAAGGDLFVPLRSRRRRVGAAVQKLQHVIPTVGLLAAAFQSLNDGAHGFELGLAIAELLTGAALLRLLLKSARAARRRHAERADHARGVDWFDIWAAGMLFTEAAERWRVHHRIPAATLTTALATLCVGLLHDRLSRRAERRQSVRLTRDELYIGRNKFSSFTARWDDIAEIGVTERTAIVRTRTGRKRTLYFVGLDNAPEVREAMREAERRLSAHGRVKTSNPDVALAQ